MSLTGLRSDLPRFSRDDRRYLAKNNPQKDLMVKSFCFSNYSTIFVD
jgi:hypothetical protein